LRKKDEQPLLYQGKTSQLADSLHQVPRSGTTVEAPAFRPVKKDAPQRGLQARRVLNGTTVVAVNLQNEIRLQPLRDVVASNPERRFCIRARVHSCRKTAKLNPGFSP
jgi:hypothetical protein